MYSDGQKKKHYKSRVSSSTQPGVLSGACGSQSYLKKKEVCQVGIVAPWRQTEAPTECDLGPGKVEAIIISRTEWWIIRRVVRWKNLWNVGCFSDFPRNYPCLDSTGVLICSNKSKCCTIPAVIFKDLITYYLLTAWTHSIKQYKNQNLRWQLLGCHCQSNLIDKSVMWRLGTFAEHGRTTENKL